MDKQAIARLLGKALVEPQFARSLEQAPEAAVQAQGVTLSASEAELLCGINWQWVVGIAAWVSDEPGLPAQEPSSEQTRPAYFDGIREVIREGDLAKMKRVLGEASDLLRAQHKLQTAVSVLEEAIRVRESTR